MSFIVCSGCGHHNRCSTCDVCEVCGTILDFDFDPNDKWLGIEPDIGVDVVDLEYEDEISGGTNSATFFPWLTED